jgi:hypothetical protein
MNHCNQIKAHTLNQWNKKIGKGTYKSQKVKLN